MQQGLLGFTRNQTAFAALALLIVMWASAFPGIRLALQGYPPIELAAVRMIIASVLFLPVVLWRGGIKARWADAPWLFASGLVGITFYNVFLNIGETTIPAGAASFIVNAAPIFTAILAWVFLNERLPATVYAGFLIAFAGVGLIAAGERDGFSFNMGALWVLGAALSQASTIIIQKRLLKTYTPLQLAAISIWIGMVCTLPFCTDLPGVVRNASAASTWAIVYLALVPMLLGFFVWFYALSILPANVTASSLYLVPPLATLIAWGLLAEMPSSLSLVGGLVTLSGVCWMQWARKRHSYKLASATV